MNGFRVTILTLLCLSVALMFYVVLYVIPGWQDEYNLYQSGVRISKYDAKSDFHRQQMRAFDPSIESPEETAARLAAEEAARKDEMSIQQAEENNIVAAAKRREEAAQARARAEAEAEAAAAAAAEAAAAQPRTIGIVVSYDPEWNYVMIHPAVIEKFSHGAVLAVRRKNVIVCEAVVDSIDIESGQVSATVRAAHMGDENSAKMPTPAAGDEVIISPFISGDELRSMSDTPSVPSLTPVNSLQPLPVEPSPAAPQPTQPAAQPQPEQPAVQPEPEPVSTPAPTDNEVQSALDAIPSAPKQDASTPRSNSSLPSLDAMLFSPQF